MDEEVAKRKTGKAPHQEANQCLPSCYAITEDKTKITLKLGPIITINTYYIGHILQSMLSLCKYG